MHLRKVELFLTFQRGDIEIRCDVGNDKVVMLAKLSDGRFAKDYHPVNQDKKQFYELARHSAGTTTVTYNVSYRSWPYHKTLEIQGLVYGTVVLRPPFSWDPVYTCHENDVKGFLSRMIRFVRGVEGNVIQCSLEGLLLSI